MSLEHAILGFLNYRPLSGYDLKKVFHLAPQLGELIAQRPDVVGGFVTFDHAATKAHQLQQPLLVLWLWRLIGQGLLR